LNVFCNGLPLCTSVTVTTVALIATQLGNEELERLLPAFYNTSVTELHLPRNRIQGQRGGEVVRVLLVGNNTLLNMDLRGNPFGPEGAVGLGQGLAVNKWLQKLILSDCDIGNDGLANLVLSMGGMSNTSLTLLNLLSNSIEGEEGGRQVTLLLPRFLALNKLCINSNNLGPRAARALAPGLAAASHLESLDLSHCQLGNDGLTNLVPDGQVNRSFTHLNLDRNYIRGSVGGENVIALAARCTNLDSINVGVMTLCPDDQRRLDLLLDRKRLCTEASALAGSAFSVLFRAMEDAHRHEHGLSAIFLILQNDGDDYFSTAHNRAIE
jgi:Ran GTPase-activating protein (RanGAP) involved in mRNA processing and transport